ncbi:MAG: hypothetical protein KDD01_08640, partial [Phaeodactylibacter sp.]|nr:hypothetical protein [Phaeodactylibacter sp.]
NLFFALNPGLGARILGWSSLIITGLISWKCLFYCLLPAKGIIPPGSEAFFSKKIIVLVQKQQEPSRLPGKLLFMLFMPALS